MTTTTGVPPATHNTPLACAKGLLTGGVVGTSLAALVVGGILDHPPLLVTGVVAPPVYALLVFLAGAPRRAREAAVVLRTALATIDSREAVGGESSEVPVRFELTVVPDDESPYRVGITQDINLVDLPDYRPRGVVVVQYPPDRPWRVRIVKRPTPEWAERAASARPDAVPESAAPKVVEPPEGCAFGLFLLLGLLAGAAAVVLLFRAELFDGDGTAQPSSTGQPSVSVTSSTAVVSSALGSVSLGPGRSFLDQGELDRALGTLTQDGDTRRALTVVVQERLLSVFYAPVGTPASGLDPRELPYARFPALVEEATTTLGVQAPRTWQVIAEGLTGSPVIRVVVTGSDGTASLEADRQGRVVRRSPAR
ncbi:hypothetical protein AB0O91_37380 [Kitasatospora sp. NPDC089797]|uniref:hypothetical protein n=1 Tax=Kitasatospora sp. NPDC089797 TaxID=3155298 RepID=UPI0034409AE4